MDEMDLPLNASGASPVTAEGLSLDVPAPLLDLPLRADAETSTPDSVGARLPEHLAGETAPLAARGMAFAADAALVLLMAAAAVLAATAGEGQAPRIAALLWAGVFALYLSFFATVVPLLLFGKTVGMALTGLSARAAAASGLRVSECARRWLGTALTVVALGIPLLFTRRRRDAPSLADRLSGRALPVES